MKLSIDGYSVFAEPDMTLLDLINKLSLDDVSFFNRPIAAKIAGEFFNLNYMPVRLQDTLMDRPSIRRAMAASKGEVHLIRYSDPAGKDIYSRTAQFILFLALHQKYPKAQAKMCCTVGKALYISVSGDPSFDAALLKHQVKILVEEDIPLLRRRVATAEAINWFQKKNHPDKARLLSWRTEPYFDEYVYGDFADFYYGELAPSTGYLQGWDILPAAGGFLFLYPDDNFPECASTYEKMPNFLKVCMEAERWCELMDCATVADLNDLTSSGRIRELIRVNEALHEKLFSQIADTICQRCAKVIMLAGPSSSGKTTSANRLATQLQIHGKHPILMSLDDYYMDRDKIPLGLNGELDLEHINTIDRELFSKHIQRLLNGESVCLPTFNFLTGKREWHERTLQLFDTSVIIVEGLHALNPILLPSEVDVSLIFKLYVSPLLPLNIDNHNRIPSSLLRLLRRTVRDFETRGATVQRTMSMWDSVRRGEKRWIFPFQEQADVIFNSSTLYELAVLKKHIYPLLLAVQPEDSCYQEVRSLVKILNYVLEADVDDEIPPTSLVREFIGGNSFYKK